MFKLTIKTTNAAFDEGDRAEETARILRDAAYRVGTGESRGVLLDYNGNTVGSFEFTEED